MEGVDECRVRAVATAVVTHQLLLLYRAVLFVVGIYTT